jgi:alkylation response protein AidB-like acyl-CoA dehydrogenase
MKTMDIAKIIVLKEDNFSEKETFSYAPKNVEDALDNYIRVLEIVGEIAGDFVAGRAPEVDRIGAVFQNKEVIYAPGTVEALDRLKKADLMGFTLPRKYGGINMPKIIYAIATEMISRADASLMNIFGLQEIADTIYHFGSEEQKQRLLPRFSSGEVMGAMALTEPDAGSDLQSITLKATQNSDGRWTLNGVKGL